MHINQEKRELAEPFDPNNNSMTTFFQSAQKATHSQAEESNLVYKANITADSSQDVPPSMKETPPPEKDVDNSGNILRWYD